MLGLGGVGISAAIYIFAVMILDFTPKNLDDEHTLKLNDEAKTKK